ncbi:MAG: hypothetical protein FJ290_21260 [Planctomycetes bacterium]|nr:hypothetical protein [Planctomycetota bacterium]
MARKAPTLTFPQMVRKYHGQWLAVRVTKRDDAGQPVAGIVLAHKPNRLEVSRAARGQGPVCMMFAGPPVPEGYGMLY